MPTQEISDYVTGLSSATLTGSEEVYLATDEKTTVNAISQFAVESTGITYADLVTLTGSFVAGMLYNITDRDIWIRAIDADNLERHATRKMRIVKNTYYTVSGINKGVWNSGLTVASSDIVVWGGKVWTNTSGLIGTATDNTTLSADWTLIATSNDTYYQDKTFLILYDFINDWVAKQYDDRGNVFGIKYTSPTPNVVDYCDWGNLNVYQNTCLAVYNNSNVGGIYNNSNSSSVYDNSNSGGIYNNSNNGNISNNSNSGNISYNSNSSSIYNNSNSDNISYNSNSSSIYNNSNSGNIYNNSNNGNISNIGSTTTNIQKNINNGNISTTVVGVIQDTTVNK